MMKYMKYKKYIPLIVEEMLLILDCCLILKGAPGRFSVMEIVLANLPYAMAFVFINLFDYFGMPFIERICSGGGIVNTLIIWTAQAIGYIGLFFATLMIGSSLTGLGLLDTRFCLFLCLISTAVHHMAFLIVTRFGEKRPLLSRTRKRRTVVTCGLTRTNIEDRKIQWMAFTNKLHQLMEEHPSLPVFIVPEVGMIHSLYDCRIADFYDPESHEMLFQVILVYDEKLRDKTLRFVNRGERDNPL